jgi:hypothetical protein
LLTIGAGVYPYLCPAEGGVLAVFALAIVVDGVVVVVESEYM